MFDYYSIKEGAETVGHDWVQYWLWPALMSAVIAALFFVAFREKIDLRPETES